MRRSISAIDSRARVALGFPWKLRNKNASMTWRSSAARRCDPWSSTIGASSPCWRKTSHDAEPAVRARRSMEPAEAILCLKALPLVGSLEASELGAVVRYAEERVYQPGQLLLDPVDPVDAMHVILDGRVRLDAAELGPRAAL